MAASACGQKIGCGLLVHGRWPAHEVQVVDGKEYPSHLSRDCSYFVMESCENLVIKIVCCLELNQRSRVSSNRFPITTIANILQNLSPIFSLMIQVV